MEKKDSLKQLQKIARANDVSIYKRRKDDMGFTKKPLTKKTLRARLTRMKVPHNFGMATVCLPGYSPNRKYKRGRGAKMCLKDKEPNMSLSDLQAIAKANDVSIYKRRKDDMGFTRKPLTKKTLRARLTRMRIPYKFSTFSDMTSAYLGKRYKFGKYSGSYLKSNY